MRPPGQRGPDGDTGGQRRRPAGEDPGFELQSDEEEQRRVQEERDHLPDFEQDLLRMR